MAFLLPRIGSRYLACFWLSCALLAVSHAQARPSCKATPTPAGMIAMLDGTLNGQTPIRVALDIRPRGQVDGRYAYASSHSDIRLAGRLGRRNRLNLTEFDASGLPRATFDGTFSTRTAADSGGTPHPSAECERLTGQWKDVHTGETHAFALQLSNLQAGPITHLYGVAGAANDDIVNRAARAFRRAVLENRRDVVVQSMQYPLHVTLHGKGLTLSSPNALLARYNDIFTGSYIRAIGKAVPRLMFARYDGVMLGNGQVWFGADGKVIALNP